MADNDDVSRCERCIKTQAIIENLKHKIAQCLEETAEVEAEIEGQKNLTDKQSWEAWKEYEWVQAQYERYTETKVSMDDCVMCNNTQSHRNKSQRATSVNRNSSTSVMLPS
jgi:hypothetical protein